MNRFRIILIYVVIILTITNVVGLPEMSDGFNSKYNTTRTRLDTCEVCHTYGKNQKDSEGKHDKYINLTVYGVDIKKNLNMNGMDSVFTAIENIDSDKDGFTNIIEIHNLTFPGDKKDSPKKRNVTMLEQISRLIFG